ncbi:alpha/beta hydrolase [Verminephrobacter aporrectodeae subsp. tuberculatae]|uniref:alpha/beta fold hydrolase n=1 Tax=Verminephrobacter aporrectodeae TaxID=1110389 RepID=UPI002244D31D|nr:alpha/beta hydrolase [Verminephrobacter aporrectodeae]MCW8207714.1 alpha/beta hydrolase [Verminephrobacter aporrectodeae subsp. tuberculatae]
MKFDRLERRWLTQGGLDLAYYDAVRGRVPVVLQHGLCGSAQQTAEVFPDDDRFRLLTLECRSHGASPIGSPGDLSIARFSDDVIALIEARQLAPVILGGISMGAALSLRIAVRRPELVRALILARPAWVTAAHPMNMRPNAEVAELLAHAPAERARALFEHSATARRLAAEAPDNLATLRGLFARAPQASTAELLRRIAADGPGVSEDAVRALDVPALVLGHAADAIHPLALARSLAGLLARSEFVEITPKSVNRAAYLRDMHAALAAFMQKVPS